ncbi:MAG: EAL domain-containing protein [Gammaproteobacteria bacterium]
MNAAENSFEDTSTMRARMPPQGAGALILERLGHVTDPHLLFPLLAVLILIILWAATLHLIHVERAGAQGTAQTSVRKLLDTYQAQVVRALREIDQTLKVVQFTAETDGNQVALPELQDRSLLPPTLLFTVSVIDARGAVVASTAAVHPATVNDTSYFASLRDRPAANQDIWVDPPHRESKSGEWKLLFSRRMNARDGSFAGVVTETVDAAYFVSGYEPSMLGLEGVLGVLGTDGIFRARRSGDAVSAGETVDYASVVHPGSGGEDLPVFLAANPWDGVRRYTNSRELYDFPLAVIVGVSEQEQLATTSHDRRIYLERAGLASAVVILLAAILGRSSWQLLQSRRLASAAKVEYAERVEYLAYHDGLSGLPNRSLFSKILTRSIKLSRRHQRRLAVLFLDLDRFKQINDTLGHEAGDQLLQEVARRLESCLRDSDTVARLGGDEFVVLLPELGSGEYAAVVAQKILTLLAEPFVLVGQEFRVTASIGICTYPEDGQDEQTLTKHADIAMYQAKEEGKNNFQFYSEKLNANSLERLSLESSLRHALERNEFLLYYQAKRDTASGRITGMEALLRWEHPDLGIVAPMQFIPVAEETGLIVPIGKWVLKTACLQNVAWHNQGIPDLSMAVNLTARQFSDENLLADIAGILRETGMQPSLLELEITESLLINDVNKTLRIMAGLKAMGIRIAVDDFGTCYSSLSTLRQFPLDAIKIDRSFIRDVSSASIAHLHPEKPDLADAIIAMGRSLSLTVVAQGVETKEQADYLRVHACDEVQGFYYNKPLPTEQVTALLQDQKGSG